MTEDNAKVLYLSGFWKHLTDYEKAKFQLFEDRLCMPFDVFHEAVEKTLKRPVFTHEFARPEALRNEFNGGRPAPTMEEIINLIPEQKRIIVCL